MGIINRGSHANSAICRVGNGAACKLICLIQDVTSGVEIIQRLNRIGLAIRSGTTTHDRR